MNADSRQIRQVQTRSGTRAQTWQIQIQIHRAKIDIEIITFKGKNRKDKHDKRSRAEERNQNDQHPSVLDSTISIFLNYFCVKILENLSKFEKYSTS